MSDSELQNTDSDYTPPPSFYSTKLNKPANEDVEVILQDEKLRYLVQKYATATLTSYDVLVRLLNRASRLIHDKWAKDHRLLVFIDGHAPSLATLLNDFRTGHLSLGMALDVTNGLIDQGLTNSIPWHLVSSTLEWTAETHPDPDSPKVETGGYLGLARQCRPDLVSMYGMVASPNGYAIQYRYPGGSYTSIDYEWADISPLLAYVYTLYVPRAELPSRDPSITLARSADMVGPPAWDIHDGEKVYKGCIVKAFGERVWVARVGDSPVTIKDSYRDVDADFREGEIYDILHAKGPALGFVKVAREYDVQCNGRPIEVTVGDIPRIKTRLIMHTYGQPLKKCATLIDFLKCMYDILEAHRWAVAERNILHRDISHGNILVHAEDIDDGKVFDDMEHRPIFVNEVLNGQHFAAPMARLADMGSAAELDPEKAVSPTFVAQKSREEVEPLRCRTGTPMFVARSPALGRLLVGSVCFRPMPELPCDVAAKYQTAYASDSSGLRTFFDDDTTNHGGVYRRKDLERKYRGKSEPRQEDFKHQPRHDAESVFWCMVVFLLLAVPLGSPEEDLEASSLYAPWKHLASHRFFSIYEPADSRLHIIAADVLHWEAWLHPGLQHVARLMSLLAAQVSPEWGVLQPPPHMLHLHEAMQRIILTHIHVWDKEKKDVRFDTERTRDTTDPHSWSYRQRKKRQAAVTLAPSEKSTDIDTSVLGKRLWPDDEDEDDDDDDDDDDEEEEEEEEEEPKAKRQRMTKDESSGL